MTHLSQDMSTAESIRLPKGRVRAIALRDKDIGRISNDATSMIARCTDLFLSDLVAATLASRNRNLDSGQVVDVSSGAANKGKGRSKRRPISAEDVREAAAEGERFDFLRPILEPTTEEAGISKVRTTPTPRKRKRSENAGEINRKDSSFGDTAPQDVLGSLQGASAIPDGLRGALLGHIGLAELDGTGVQDVEKGSGVVHVDEDSDYDC